MLKRNTIQISPMLAFTVMLCLLPEVALANGAHFAAPLPFISLTIFLYGFALIIGKRYKGLTSRIVLPWIFLLIITTCWGQLKSTLILWPIYIFFNFILSLALKYRVVYGSNGQDRVWYGTWLLVLICGGLLSFFLEPLQRIAWVGFYSPMFGAYFHAAFYALALPILFWHVYRLKG